jgi:hypothetical protein
MKHPETSISLLLVVSFPNFATCSLDTEPYLEYAPTHAHCPSDVEWIRPAHGLNPSEAKWVHGRKAVVLDNLAEYLHRLELKDFDVTSYVKAINHSEYKMSHLLASRSAEGATPRPILALE